MNKVFGLLIVLSHALFLEFEFGLSSFCSLVGKEVNELSLQHTVYLRGSSFHVLVNSRVAELA